jgi:hypothetical protein
MGELCVRDMQQWLIPLSMMIIGFTSMLLLYKVCSYVTIDFDQFQ